jgi:hypothetical protein
MQGIISSSPKLCCKVPIYAGYHQLVPLDPCRVYLRPQSSNIFTIHIALQVAASLATFNPFPLWSCIPWTPYRRLATYLQYILLSRLQPARPPSIPSHSGRAYLGPHTSNIVAVFQPMPAYARPGGREVVLQACGFASK